MPQLCQAVPYEKQRLLDESEMYLADLQTSDPAGIAWNTMKLNDVKKRIREWNRRN